MWDKFSIFLAENGYIPCSSFIKLWLQFIKMFYCLFLGIWPSARGLNRFFWNFQKFQFFSGNWCLLWWNIALFGLTGLVVTRKSILSLENWSFDSMTEFFLSKFHLHFYNSNYSDFLSPKHAKTLQKLLNFPFVNINRIRQNYLLFTQLCI